MFCVIINVNAVTFDQLNACFVFLTNFFVGWCFAYLPMSKAWSLYILIQCKCMAFSSDLASLMHKPFFKTLLCISVKKLRHFHQFPSGVAVFPKTRRMQSHSFFSQTIILVIAEQWKLFLFHTAAVDGYYLQAQQESTIWHLFSPS